MINLNKLNELGAFISDEMVQKEIKFSQEDGAEEHVFTVFVRRLSVGFQEKLWGDMKDDISKMALMISESIRLGDDGKEAMTYDQAFKLNPRLGLALTIAINEVNGGERKNSVPPTS